MRLDPLDPIPGKEKLILGTDTTPLHVENPLTGERGVEGE